MDEFPSAFTTLAEFDLHHEGLNFWQKKPFPQKPCSEGPHMS
jgi:hypothetical protein